MSVTPPIDIAPLTSNPRVIDELADILIAVVAAGGSVSFMHPLRRPEAEAFWAGSLAAADRGERLVLGARLGGQLAATVTLAFATALTREAERIAVANGRTLLTLDTAEEDGAPGFYERLGYIRVGLIPDYALKPHGGLTATILYYKRLGTNG
jgi:hypothetical protein